MPWQVKAKEPGLTVTFNCDTAEVALERARSFTSRDYVTVTVTDPDGKLLTIEELDASLRREAKGAPEPLADAGV